MTFNADIIIDHIRGLADIWRQQQIDCLNASLAVKHDADDDLPLVRTMLKREIDAMRAHQSAIVLDGLANELEDLKSQLSEHMEES